MVAAARLVTNGVPTPSRIDCLWWLIQILSIRGAGIRGITLSCSLPSSSNMCVLAQFRSYCVVKEEESYFVLFLLRFSHLARYTITRV